MHWREVHNKSAAHGSTCGNRGSRGKSYNARNSRESETEEILEGKEIDLNGPDIREIASPLKIETLNENVGGITDNEDDEEVTINVKGENLDMEIEAMKLPYDFEDEHSMSNRS